MEGRKEGRKERNEGDYMKEVAHRCSGLHIQHSQPKKGREEGSKEGKQEGRKEGRVMKEGKKSFFKGRTSRQNCIDYIRNGSGN